jgi:polyhydroxybutyrate depolymerase
MWRRKVMRNQNIVRTCGIVVLLLSLTPLAFGQGEVLDETLMHEGVERTYKLFIPSTYSPGSATPLVLNLHGHRGNADQQMVSSAMNSVAEEEGFIVAYPNGVDDTWKFSNDNDINFIDELLETIGSQYSVDASRVYSTGLSKGGMFSYVLAVTRPYTFAAIAPVAGFRRIDEQQDGSGLHPPWVPRVPPRPVPLMHIHGTGDLAGPYHGGPRPSDPDGKIYPSVEDVLNEWLACNGCDATPSVSELPDIMPDDGSTVSILSWGDCDTYTSVDGDEIVANVVHYRVNGGGHNWPVLEADRAANLDAIEITWGADLLPYFMPLNSDFSASAAMWEFFEQHVVAVPEPNGLALAFVALLGLMSRLRRPI